MDAAFRGFLFRRLSAVQNTWRCALRDRMCMGLREWGPVLLQRLGDHIQNCLDRARQCKDAAAAAAPSVFSVHPEI